MQVIQEVSVAEEWVKNVWNEARVEANLRDKADKALGAAKQKNQELSTQLTTEEKARKSIKAGLKNAQDQAEDQRKKLHHIEIELATQKQLVLELRADLQKVKEAAQTTKEASKTSEQPSYKRGVQETKIRLTDELAEVCRDYCKEVWAEALNRAKVPTTSEWRLAENTFFLEDIRKVPAAVPPPAILTFPPSEQPSTTQASLPPSEVSKRPNKEAEVAEGKEAGQWGPQPKDKGKGEEAKVLPKAKGKEVAPEIKDADCKAKDATAKAKNANSTAKDANLKDDPPRAKAQFQDFSFLFCTSSLFFCCGSLPLFVMYPPFPYLMERYQLWLHKSLFSLQCLSIVGVMFLSADTHTITKACNNNLPLTETNYTCMHGKKSG